MITAKEQTYNLITPQHWDLDGEYLGALKGLLERSLKE